MVVVVNNPYIRPAISWGEAEVLRDSHDSKRSSP